MFELRWVVAPDGPDRVSDTDTVMLYISAERFVFLEYRYRTNEEEVGIQPPIWSEWETVPVVPFKNENP